MAAPILETPDLLIRPFEKGDLKTFADYRAQEAVARYQSWDSFNEEDALKLFQSMDYSKFGSPGHWYQLAIIRKKDGVLLGDLAVHFIDKDQMEIGFTISPKHQGQSIAKRAVTRLLDYLFGELHKHRVIAITDTRNLAANKLLESLQFRREAHFVQNIFFKGAWSDEYQYALLASEWPKTHIKLSTDTGPSAT